MTIEVENLSTPQKQPLLTVVSVVYPLAFLTRANKLFTKSNTELSTDGTPRYIPNPKASGTYCLQDCTKDYTPIYDKKILKQYM